MDRGIKMLGALFIFLSVSILLPAAALAEAIFVSGQVSGTWSADSVVVADSIWIAAGDTLVIEPGVQVLFLDYFNFEVRDGALLQAVGTETDSIEFIPFLQGDRWLGFDFFHPLDQSILEYCHIAHALTSGIHMELSAITISHCLIESCEAPSGVEGGGALEIMNESNPLIENCLLRDNNSVDYGGAIYCENSSPVIRGNIIEDNLAGYALNSDGGAIACFDHSSPQIINNMIRNNIAHPTGSFSMGQGSGGAIFCVNGSSPLISGNMITGNQVIVEPQTTSNGGGISIYSSSPEIRNNVFAENHAWGNNGGALYLSQSGSIITNNVFYNNAAGDSGGALYVGEFSSALMTNSIVYGNEAEFGPQIFQQNSDFAVTYSDIQEGWEGAGNIDVDPAFRDPMSGDYHLQDSIACGDLSYSPCIDAGDPAVLDYLLDCSRGLAAERSDMGAYGGGDSLQTAIAEDGSDLPLDIELSGNYPNPFNASTNISYTINAANRAEGRSTHVTLRVYNILGQKVRTLVDKNVPPGSYNVVWDARSQDGGEVASGLYLYKLKAGDVDQTMKMVLLR